MPVSFLLSNRTENGNEEVYLVFVIIRVREEGDELAACAFLPKRHRDGCQPLNGVESQRDILILQLISACIISAI